MKKVLLMEVTEKCPNIPFFFFESAKLRHHLESDKIMDVDGGKYLINSGHIGGLYYVSPEIDVFISDANYKRYFKTG